MGNFIFLKEIVEFRGKQPVRAHFIFFFPVRMGNLLNASKHTTSCDLNRKCRRTGEEHSSPFPLSIDVCLADGGAPETTNAHVEVKIDLNPILKTMLSKPMQDAAEKFADLIAVMPYN